MPRTKKKEEKISVDQLVAEAISNKDILDDYIQKLKGADRHDRQLSAQVIYGIAKQDSKIIAPYISNVIDALSRPENQTRWLALDTITLLVSEESRKCEKVIEPAEVALFDEGSGFLRLSAYRFLCEFGKTSATRSKKVWSLIDEATQCYHGDPEFFDMLKCLIDFSAGDLDKQVKKELVKLMTYDATFSKGKLQEKAKLIICNAKKK